LSCLKQFASNAMAKTVLNKSEPYNV
jgi:hypothetical protein